MFNKTKDLTLAVFAAASLTFAGGAGPVDAQDLQELDIPLCGGAIVPDVPEDVLMHVPEAGTGSSAATTHLKKADPTKIHVIDIAFIYAGSISDRAKLLRKVEAAVLRANVIFARSGVNAKLRTVAFRPDHQYGISYDGAIDRSHVDRVFRELAKALPDVRADYGADLLYAITAERPGPCGYGFVRTKGADVDFARKYTSLGLIRNGTGNFGCLGDTDVLAHEVGHNLGLDHNIENATGLTPFVSYGRGYQGRNINDHSYGTVMAVGASTTFYRFSTNSVHDGLSMGTSDANAAEALLYTIEDASNYSPTRIPDPAPDYKCSESSTATCLQSGRFRVEARVSYVDSSGERVENARAKVRRARINGVTRTTSLFYFFGESNPELLVKVVDGCGVNGRYWVFGSAGTDLDHQVIVTDNATGVTIPYHRNASLSLINDTNAFPCGGSGVFGHRTSPLRAGQQAPGSRSAQDTGVRRSARLRERQAVSAAAAADPVRRSGLSGRRATFAAKAADPLLPDLQDGPHRGGHGAPGPAEDSAGAPRDFGCLLPGWSAVCLQDGRFKVSGHAIKPDGERVAAKMKDAVIGDEASLFYFFEFDNVELLVKVLDACGVNGKYWVFGSAATDLEYTIEIEDMAMARGQKKTYSRNSANPLINDTNAFACE